jgi:hypothetical protein
VQNVFRLIADVTKGTPVTNCVTKAYYIGFYGRYEVLLFGRNSITVLQENNSSVDIWYLFYRIGIVTCKIPGMKNLQIEIANVQRHLSHTSEKRNKKY